jgi:hypothetical protein
MTKYIHTPTQESYDKLMKEAERLGYRWGGGTLPTKLNNWGKYKKETCICFEEDKTLGYCNREWFKANNYKLITKLEESMQQGDILTDGESERKILGICGEVYLMSDGRFNRFFGAYTQQDLEDDGWKLKEEETETIVSMSEVAEKFGVDVKKLKIKK